MWKRVSAHAGVTAACIVCAATAAADSLELDMRAATPERETVARIEAVDSWFTTLATLLFEVDGLEPGAYSVVLLEQADCRDAAAGSIYRRPEDPLEAPTGALGEIAVTPDGGVTRTLSLKPPKLVAEAEKLTVTEMRGHALVFRAGGASGAVAACGVMPVADSLVN